MELPPSEIFWLKTSYQNIVETSLQLSKRSAPEETPYVHKYKAIENLTSLVNQYHKYPYKFIPYCILGEIYNEVEQTSDSIKNYEQSL